jgi:hypothetical protein
MASSWKKENGKNQPIFSSSPFEIYSHCPAVKLNIELERQKISSPFYVIAIETSI